MAATTPNMGLTTWSISDYFNDVQLRHNFELLDAHDHSPGHGKLINQSGLAASSVGTINIASGAITASQINTSANIVGSQLAPNASIAGSQLASNANVLGSQLSPSAEILDTQLRAPSNPIYQTFLAVSAGIDGAISDNVLSTGVSMTSTNVTTLGQNSVPSPIPYVFYLDPAELLIKDGASLLANGSNSGTATKLTKFSIRVTLTGNNTNANTTFNIKLSNVTFGASGGAHFTVPAIGSTVTNSALSVATPTVGGGGVTNVATLTINEFAISQGYYAFVVNTGGAAGSSYTGVHVRLVYRYTDS